MTKGLIRVMQGAAAAGLLAWLWHVADGQEALRRLAGAHPGWLLAALAALSGQIVLSALRWRLTAAQLGIVIDRATAVREYYLSQIVNQTLPGGVLGDAGRAVRARAQAGLLASGQAVVFERLAGQIAIFVLMVAAFGATLAVPGGLDWPGWAIWPVAALIAAGLGLPLILWGMARIVRGRPGRMLAQLWAGMRLCLLAREVRGRQALLSIGTTLANVAGFALCAEAVGAPIPVAAALALVPVILFAMVVPLTIGGWGLREGAAAAFLPLAGVSQPEAMATSVAFGLVFLAASLPGLLVVMGGGLRRTA